MTVITLSRSMVLIGMIKLSHSNKCPRCCTKWQISTWTVMLIIARKFKSVCHHVKLKLISHTGLLYDSVSQQNKCNSNKTHTVMYCLWILRTHIFWGGFISSSETICFPIPSDEFLWQCGAGCHDIYWAHLWAHRNEHLEFGISNAIKAAEASLSWLCWCKVRICCPNRNPVDPCKVQGLFGLGFGHG